LREHFIGDEQDPSCYVANFRGLDELTVSINTDFSGDREEMEMSFAVEPWRVPYFPFVFVLILTLFASFCSAPIRYLCFDKIFIPCCCPYSETD
jgi:hypothetical protein